MSLRRNQSSGAGGWNRRSSNVVVARGAHEAPPPRTLQRAWGVCTKPSEESANSRSRSSTRSRQVCSTSISSSRLLVQALEISASTALTGEIKGQSSPEDFAPSFGSGRPTSAAELRKALTAQGYTAGWRPVAWLTAAINSRPICRGRFSQRSSRWLSDSRSSSMPVGVQ